MKRKLIITGAILLALGFVLLNAGKRLGGENYATVYLFGETMEVNAPFTSGAGHGVVRFHGSVAVYEDAVATPSLSLSPGLEFQSVEVEVDLGQVNLYSGGDSFQVISNGQDGIDAIEVENDDGVLKVSGAGTVDILVPAGRSLHRVDISNDLGDVRLTGLSIDELYVSMSAGDLACENVTVYDRLEAEASLGSISYMGNIEAEAASFSADAGAIELNLARPATDYSYELEADVGMVYVDGQKRASKLTANNGDGGRHLEAEASLGSITVNFGMDTAWQEQEAVIDFLTEEGANVVAVPKEDALPGTFHSVESTDVVDIVDAVAEH